MTSPKKIYIGEPIKSWSTKQLLSDDMCYISIEALKEWIDQQAGIRRADLGTNFTLSQLEKFIEL